MALIEQMFKESRDEAKECLEKYLDGEFDTEKFQVLIVFHEQVAKIMENMLQIVAFGAEHGKDFINRMMSTKFDDDTTLFDIATIGITPDEMKDMPDTKFKEVLEKRAQWMKQELKTLREVFKEMKQAAKKGS